jgi:hypothetical protein
MGSPLSARLFCCVAVALSATAVAPGCSQGEGDGQIQGTLNVPACWNGSFELAADFFAANPYRQGMAMRFQSGSDFQNFSDGLSVLLSDINAVRPSSTSPGKYREALRVALPPGVAPPGTPVKPDPNPALVSATLYLQRTCRTETVTLQAVDQVSPPTDNTTCSAPAILGADPTQGCGADKQAAAGFGTGKSVIAFTSVANGKLDEPTAAERLNAGCFDIYLADPREAQPGGQGPPPPCRGHLRGFFSFFFERGRPSQPFP